MSDKTKKHKYKIGDRVRCITNEYRNVKKEQVYTVTWASPSDRRAFRLDAMYGTWTLFDQDFEPATCDFNELINADNKSDLFRYLRREADSLSE